MKKLTMILALSILFINAGYAHYLSIPEKCQVYINGELAGETNVTEMNEKRVRRFEEYTLKAQGILKLNLDVEYRSWENGKEEVTFTFETRNYGFFHGDDHYLKVKKVGAYLWKSMNAYDEKYDEIELIPDDLDKKIFAIGDFEFKCL